MNADCPFLAKHGEFHKRWAECIQPLNGMPEFGPQLTWNGARSALATLALDVSQLSLRDKFKELIKAHEVQDNAGRAQSGSDAIVDETIALLDDILALVKDQRDDKVREKVDAHAKETALNEQGQKIRDAAMKAVGKRTQSGTLDKQTIFHRIHPHFQDIDGQGSSPRKRVQDFNSMSAISAFLEKKADLDIQRMELEQRKLDFEIQKWEASRAQQSAQAELLTVLLKQHKLD